MLDWDKNLNVHDTLLIEPDAVDFSTTYLELKNPKKKKKAKNELGENKWNEDKWEKDEWNENEWKEKTAFEVHGMLHLWTEIIPDFFDITSDRPAVLCVWDVTNPTTWLWITLVRADDFSKDPNNPFSQATVINPHRSKEFWVWNWKLKMGVECKYNLIDKMPEANWFTPDIVWSFSTKNWWTFEGVYTHRFQKWKDSDAFRLSIAKQINEKLQLTGQVLYDTWYAKKVCWRAIIDLNLWNGFKVQLSWVIKNDKFTPTFWLIYQR